MLSEKLTELIDGYVADIKGLNKRGGDEIETQKLLVSYFVPEKYNAKTGRLWEDINFNLRTTTEFLAECKMYLQEFQEMSTTEQEETAALVWGGDWNYYEKMLFADIWEDYRDIEMAHMKWTETYKLLCEELNV